MQSLESPIGKWFWVIISACLVAWVMDGIESHAVSVVELPRLGPDYWAVQDSVEEPIASGINNAGTVVGQTGSNPRLSGEGAAVRWNNGAIEVLPRFPNAPSGGVNFAAADVNDLGTVVGFSAFPSPTSPTLAHAAKWVGSDVTDLGTLPGYDSSTASAINDSGQIAGRSTVGGFFTGSRLPVRWSADGQISPLGLLPTQDAALIQNGQTVHDRGGTSDINGAGIIVGYSELFGGDTPAEQLPAYWDDVTAGALSLQSGYNYGSASGINDLGKIVGSIATLQDFSFTDYRAVVWDDVGSEPHVLAMPASVDYGFATAVNSLGQIVGSGADSPSSARFGSATHSLLWNADGSVVDLTPHLQAAFPGDYQFRLSDINDRGQIVGFARAGVNSGLDGIAFVLTIPEPSASVLMLCAIAARWIDFRRL